VSAIMNEVDRELSPTLVNLSVTLWPM